MHESKHATGDQSPQRVYSTIFDISKIDMHIIHEHSDTVVKDMITGWKQYMDWELLIHTKLAQLTV